MRRERPETREAPAEKRREPPTTSTMRVSLMGEDAFVILSRRRRIPPQIGEIPLYRGLTATCGGFFGYASE
jgi:hypothetical protein